jgi:hypothetical protein
MELEILRPLFIKYRIDDLLSLVRKYLRELNSQDQWINRIALYDFIPEKYVRPICIYMEYPKGISVYERDILFEMCHNYLMKRYNDKDLINMDDKILKCKDKKSDIFVRCNCRNPNYANGLTTMYMLIRFYPDIMPRMDHVDHVYRTAMEQIYNK